MARRLLSYNKHKSVNPRPELYRQRIKARMEFHRKHMFYENQGIVFSKIDVDKIMDMIRDGVDNHPILTFCTDGEFRLTMELPRGYGIATYIIGRYDWVYPLPKRDAEISFVVNKKELEAFKISMPYLTSRDHTAFNFVFNENIPCIVVTNCNNGLMYIINGDKKRKRSLIRARELEYTLQSRNYFKAVLPYEAFRDNINQIYAASRTDHIHMTIDKSGEISYRLGKLKGLFGSIRDYYLYNSPPVWWGCEEPTLSVIYKLSILRKIVEKSDYPYYTSITMYILYKSKITLMAFTLNGIEYRYTLFPLSAEEKKKEED